MGCGLRPTRCAAHGMQAAVNTNNAERVQYGKNRPGSLHGGCDVYTGMVGLYERQQIERAPTAKMWDGTDSGGIRTPAIGSLRL